METREQANARLVHQAGVRRESAAVIKISPEHRAKLGESMPVVVVLGALGAAAIVCGGVAVRYHEQIDRGLTYLASWVRGVLG